MPISTPHRPTAAPINEGIFFTTVIIFPLLLGMLASIIMSRYEEPRNIVTLWPSLAVWLMSVTVLCYVDPVLARLRSYPVEERFFWLFAMLLLSVASTVMSGLLYGGFLLN